MSDRNDNDFRFILFVQTLKNLKVVDFIYAVKFKFILTFIQR